MALLITKKCINCDMCEPECPNEAISMGDSIYEISSDECTEYIGHYDAPTCRKVCPIPNTILEDPVRVEAEEQLWNKFVLMHHADKPQSRRHLTMKPLPYLCNKRITYRPNKTLRVAIRHRPEPNLR